MHILVTIVLTYVFRQAKKKKKRNEALTKYKGRKERKVQL